jgi:medium-chain acyl-[acyl-carrier-protein] hydrolase
VDGQQNTKELIAMPAPTETWFKCFAHGSRAPRWRLLCLPYAGGSAGIYSRWANYLPSDVELLAVQYPGREERMGETPIGDLLTLARTLAGIVQALPPRPYAVFGHSLGALIGFEMVRALRKKGQPLPQWLFLSGSGGPRINTYCDNPRHRWTDEAFVEELRRMDGTPAELLENPELMGLVLPMLRADLAAVDTYNYADALALHVPIQAIGGLDDADVSRERLAEWKQETSAEFSLCMLAGNHFFLHDAAPLICDLLNRQMEREMSEQPESA